MQTRQELSSDVLLAVAFLPQDLLLQWCLLATPLTLAESSSVELESGRASWLALPS